MNSSIWKIRSGGCFQVNCLVWKLFWLKQVNCWSCKKIEELIPLFASLPASYPLSEELNCSQNCSFLYKAYFGVASSSRKLWLDKWLTVLFVYFFFREYGLSYLSLRASIGLWTAILCIILVATDASSLVCYITRFTEEAFASLICIIFIYEALEKLFHLSETYPINMHNDLDLLTKYS